MAKMFRTLTLLALAVGLVVGVAGAADVKTGLVGYWPMDGNANDLSGNGHDGVLMENPDFVAGQRGQAVQLVGPVGGDAQHVHIPGLSLTSDNVTWVAWINGSNNHDWTGIMMSRGTNDTGMGFGQGGTLHYTWAGDSTWNWHIGPVIPLNTWTMVAISLDPAIATAYVYTDAGGLQSAVSDGYTHPAETIDDLRFGWDNCCDAGGRWFGGIMDELMLYERALSEGDILELATSGAAAVELSGKLTTTWGNLK